MSAWYRIKKAAAGDHCDFVTLSHEDAKQAIAGAREEYGAEALEALEQELRAAHEEIIRLQRPDSEPEPEEVKPTEPPPPPVKSNYWR
jgi:hypothetical protein